MPQPSARAELRQVCIYFGVADVYELNELNLRCDQALIKSSEFDPQDTTLVNNQIKEQLETLSLAELPEDERKTIQNILWLWYHHATTVCIWQRKNLEQARVYCETALTYLYTGHPNTITPMLCMLLRGEIYKATRWGKEMVAAVERPYAEHLLEEYKKGVFN